MPCPDTASISPHVDGQAGTNGSPVSGLIDDRAAMTPTAGIAHGRQYVPSVSAVS